MSKAILWRWTMPAIILSAGAVWAWSTLAQNDAAPAADAVQPAEPAPSMSESEQIGYAYGYLVGDDFSALGDDLDVDAFVEAFRSAHAGEEPRMTREAMQVVLLTHQQRIQAEAMDRAAGEARENLAAGEAFLEAKRAEEGVVETESGLLYKVIEAGEGATPQIGDQIVVHYEGAFIDGEVFDSSFQRGAPENWVMSADFIAGWVEGMQLMPAGSTYEFYIHPDLGYGQGGRLPPNSTLVFKVQLIEVTPAEAGEADPAN